MTTGLLRKYRRMRDFRATREPRGGRPRSAGRKLSYFIQRHAATRLHYDLRLEVDGVLKSWAVPKGPSLDPRDRRLAVHVEDHPLEYGSFEGEIPKGQYGAGNVSVWDRGEWIPDGDPRAGLARGRLKFRLEGKRLTGRWALVAMSGAAGAGGKNWLLIKEKDEAVRPPPRDLDRVEPQLATLAAKVPAGPGWMHEVKFDGYRLLAHAGRGEAVLRSRRGLDWTHRFPALEKALKGLVAESAVLDGEAVALDEAGRSRFQLLQNALSEKRTDAVVYYAFDLLELDGRDLRGEPLAERKAALKGLLAASAGKEGPEFRRRVRYSDEFDGKGEGLFRNACKLGLEGVVSKRVDAPYRSGRTEDWLKVKCLQGQEFAIAGYTDPAGARAGFGALVLGVREEGELRYAGRVGTGFTAASLKELRGRLGKLGAARCPLAKPPPGPEARGVHWVKPVLVAEVAFTGWTRDGVLRHPSFKGLREDKPAAEAVIERSAAPPRLTHPERVVYPGAGITKLELARYYEAAARRMLPHLAGRPLALVRCPGGVGKPCFYQKNAGDTFPAGVRAGDGFVYVEDERGLAALAQAGVLEIHPWGCRAADIEHPDVLTFDLDPGPATTPRVLADAARDTRARLRTLGLGAFLKTTGGKGLHVVVPLKPGASWPEAKAFCKAFAELMAADAPALYTARLGKAARRGRLFIDYLRNERGATAVAAYSPRARPGAPVSTPLAWTELTPSMRSDRFDVRTVLPRLKRDPWKDFERARRELPRARGR